MTGVIDLHPKRRLLEQLILAADRESAAHLVELLSGIDEDLLRLQLLLRPQSLHQHHHRENPCNSSPTLRLTTRPPG